MNKKLRRHLFEICERVLDVLAIIAIFDFLISFLDFSFDFFFIYLPEFFQNVLG